MNNVIGKSVNAAVPAVIGTSNDLHPGTQGVGVEGVSELGPGVYGHSTSGRGVVARSVGNYGLRAHSDNLSGIRSSSTNGTAIEGASNASGGIGIDGRCDTGTGVRGNSAQHIGVAGFSDTFIGVSGESAQFEGVRGTAHNKDHGAVVGKHMGGGIGIYGEGETAGYFQGEVKVTGKVTAHDGFFQGEVTVIGTVTANDFHISGADCAEDFDVCDAKLAEPGTVMVMGGQGALHPSYKPYDKCVAGVVSGAGSFKPGLILDHQTDQADRMPIALFGKVYCKVDARPAPIEVGDLLTTSSEPGHAMKASESSQAFGAVIGKALRPLEDGQGLIPILIALQ